MKAKFSTLSGQLGQLGPMALTRFGMLRALAVTYGLGIACSDSAGPGDDHFELAFARAERGSFASDVYVSRADGSNARRLTTTGDAGTPRWSPRGQKIAFASSTSYSANLSSNAIEVINADGTDRQAVAAGTDPAWSPDGAQIGFTGYVEVVFPNGGGKPTKIYQVYTMMADGSNQTRLAPDSAYNYMGSWSPDGNRIAFTRFTVAIGTDEIFVMAPDGTLASRVRLTANGLSNRSPVWSHSGAKIAFVGWQDPHESIYSMNPDASGQLRLTSGTADDFCPAWSPDDSRIAFTSNRDGYFQIYLMNADGTNQVRIESDFSDTCPSWKSP
jgi:Tol biopolymer transport system component